MIVSIPALPIDRANGVARDTAHGADPTTAEPEGQLVSDLPEMRVPSQARPRQDGGSRR